MLTRQRLLCSLLFLGLVAGSEASDTSPAAEALAKLRTLAGDWEGPVEWTGARTDKGRMNVSYSVTGYGSAVVENLSGDGPPAMTSVYHLDGADLRMTHFCGAQNQPRLKASRIDLASGAIDFAFVDITNLKSPDAPHVYGAELRFADADHITLTFLFQSGGQKSREKIDLKRIARRAA
ncbi:MAG TPA: hypothetical protein VF376_11930 [Thermoanaerobaculia bacterium]